MIVFKNVRYKNFLKTGNTFTQVNLNENELTLVIGKNGEGKSTFIDALTFVLFNKPFRDINKPQLVNSVNKKDTLVEVEFFVGTLEYKVVRGMKPDIFQIYRNSVLIPQNDKAKDYQDTLEKSILKINYKSFCQIVVLGKANFKPFMQLDKAERRNIIENLLDLQIFTNMNTLLKERIISNNELLLNCNQQKKIIEERMRLIKEHYLEIQKNNTSLIDEKKDIIEHTYESIANLGVQVKEKQSIIENLSKSVEQESILKEKMSNLVSIKHKIEAKLGQLTKEVHFFNEHDNCPTCKQPINIEFKQETVKTKTEQIDKANGNMDILIKQYDSTNEKIKEILNIHAEININNLELHRLNTQINSLEEYKSTLEREIKNISKNIDSMDNSKIGETEKELEEQKKSYTSIVEQKQVMTILTNLLKDNGIKARIIKQYIPIINKFINNYLSQMEFMCQFDLDEEFKETIKSRYRDEFSYGSFSEGQKQMIDLSLLFTWRSISKLKNSVNTNLLIFDEILDGSLDSDNTEHFMSIIKTLTSKENVFIISHKEQLIDKFENIIKFQVEKNFSKIVSE